MLYRPYIPSSDCTSASIASKPQLIYRHSVLEGRPHFTVFIHWKQTVVTMTTMDAKVVLSGTMWCLRWLLFGCMVVIVTIVRFQCMGQHDLSDIWDMLHCIWYDPDTLSLNIHRPAKRPTKGHKKPTERHSLCYSYDDNKCPLQPATISYHGMIEASICEKHINAI